MVCSSSRVQVWYLRFLLCFTYVLVCAAWAQLCVHDGCQSFITSYHKDESFGSHNGISRVREYSVFFCVCRWSWKDGVVYLLKRFAVFLLYKGRKLCRFHVIPWHTRQCSARKEIRNTRSATPLTSDRSVTHVHGVQPKPMSFCTCRDSAKA